MLSKLRHQLQASLKFYALVVVVCAGILIVWGWLTDTRFMIAAAMCTLCGTASNCAAVRLNGGRMPVYTRVDLSQSPSHCNAHGGTRVPWLCDWIRVPWGRRYVRVLSLGDCLLSAGVLVAFFGPELETWWRW